jgi:uncharacterized membrane protein
MGVTGQILAGVAIYKHFNFEKSAGHGLFLVVEVALTLFMPNFTHRIVTTLGAALALFFALFQAGLPGFALPLTAAACAYIWRNEINLAPHAVIWRPVGYGLALGIFLIAALERFTGATGFFSHHHSNGWLQRHGMTVGTVMVAVVFIAVVIHILKELALELDSTSGQIILFCTLLIMGLSIPAHGLAAALLIMILGFAAANRVLTGFGLLALFSFLSHYYFSMQETLLFKSLILLMSGAILLAVRYGIQRLYPVKGALNA